MAVVLKNPTAEDLAKKGNEHLEATDVIVTSSNGAGAYESLAFIKMSDNPVDPNTSNPIVFSADQNWYFDSDVVWGHIDINANGADGMAAEGSTRPVYFTNLGGQLIAERISINGMTNYMCTSRYNPLWRTGHRDYKGCFGSNGRWGSAGTYGIKLVNTNYSTQTITSLYDRYGDQAYGFSKGIFEFIEAEGGVTILQMKSDFLNDDGYFDHSSFPVDYAGSGARSGQTYITMPGSTTDWTTSTAYTTGQYINDDTVNRIYQVQGDYTSGASVAADILNNDLVELPKRSGTAYDITIRFNYFHDCRKGEFLYLCHTGATASQHHSMHVRIHDNVFARAGREALQLGRLIPNMDKYAISTDDSVSQWKSRIYNNRIHTSATAWLLENPDGAANNQDGCVQLQCRNGGVEFDHNIAQGGGEFTVFVSQDSDGGISTGNFAQIASEGDYETYVHIHHNYIGQSRNIAMYLQSSLSSGDRRMRIENNYFGTNPFTYDDFYGDSELNYLITGNDDDTYIDIVNNVHQDSGKALIGAFSPISSRINVEIASPNNTTDADMAQPGVVLAPYAVSPATIYNWTKEIGRKAGDGGGTQPGSFISILQNDILLVDNQSFYPAKSNHQSNVSNSEPEAGSSYTTYFSKNSPNGVIDDIRTPSTDPYNILNIGISNTYNDVTSTKTTHRGTSSILNWS